MPEKTKPDKANLKQRKEKAKNSVAGKSEIDEEISKEGNWSDDQKEKSYYYDDSYGYEIYNPGDEDEDDE